MLRNIKHLILDNDRLFTAKFCGIQKDAGVMFVRTAVQTPKTNAVAERWVQTFGERHLRRVPSDFADHYRQERPHQSLGNAPIEPSARQPSTNGEIVADERLSGLLCSYRRVA